jgi:outer membrane protein W
MKNIRTIILTAFMLLTISANAQKQKGSLKFNLTYNYSSPLSRFKSDLVKDNSPRGARGSVMYFFNDQLSAGIESGFQDYYQKYPRDLYSIGKSQDVSAVLTNSIQTTPFLLKAKYFPLSGSVVKPYVSIGAGVNLSNFNQYFGEFGSSQTNVGFLAHGGLGVMIPFGKMHTSGINISGAYEYAPYKKYGYHDLNSMNFQAGVVFQID